MLPAVKTTVSPTIQHSRKRVLELYKLYMQKSQEIVDMHNLPLSVDQVRKRIRQEFKKYKYLEDVSVINVQLFKGRIELEEIMNHWKQTTHVMRYFENDVYRVRNQDFLSKFYANE